MIDEGGRQGVAFDLLLKPDLDLLEIFCELLLLPLQPGLLLSLPLLFLLLVLLLSLDAVKFFALRIRLHLLKFI